jgi:hypothetical protein
MWRQQVGERRNITLEGSKPPVRRLQTANA